MNIKQHDYYLRHPNYEAWRSESETLRARNSGAFDELNRPDQSDPFGLHEINTAAMLSDSPSRPRRIAASRYQPANWFSEYGAILKARELIAKGFPSDLSGWLFITLTFDREKYASPEEAYDIGKRHLSQMMYLLRQHTEENFRYCWKLEFHRDGWPHYHFLIDYHQRLDYKQVWKLWGKGRVDVKRVKDQSFDYLFKYTAKASSLPDWVLEMNTLRIFQTSRGFFGNLQSQSAPKTSDGVPPPLNTEKRKLTLGQKLDRWARTATLQHDSGRRRRVILECTFHHMMVVEFQFQVITGTLKPDNTAHKVITTTDRLIQWIRT